MQTAPIRQRLGRLCPRHHQKNDDVNPGLLLQRAARGLLTCHCRRKRRKLRPAFPALPRAVVQSSACMYVSVSHRARKPGGRVATREVVPVRSVRSAARAGGPRFAAAPCFFPAAADVDRRTQLLGVSNREEAHIAYQYYTSKLYCYCICMYVGSIRENI
jgi:hypothetical protein